VQDPVKENTCHPEQIAVVQVMRLEIPRRERIDQPLAVLFADGR
jgi:hypothetical protein